MRFIINELYQSIFIYIFQAVHAQEAVSMYYVNKTLHIC